ncbi:DUF2149 domain-containing protein [Derxia gummosa]|uniref:DUF2149 domain-containing protein n=1 Tax=Derxia gummosa DSM 723 TaxID=1121388 RepID=A0A8B6X0T2_9BURK|nr:DUF2149 domain-containing protein [Derxia gummosa]
MRNRLDESLEEDDPLLSVVNLVDVFLVIIAALFVTVANQPLNLFGGEDVTVIRNPGKPDMSIVVRSAGRIERYEADGAGGKGQGVRAGSAWRMPDGSMVWVPEGGAAGEAR